MTKAIIHCKVNYSDYLYDLASSHQFDMFVKDDEAHIIVDDVPYNPEDHTDPDVQLCDYYGIDYDQVNCIEAHEEPSAPSWVPEDLKELSESSWGKEHIQFITV